VLFFSVIQIFNLLHIGYSVQFFVTGINGDVNFDHNIALPWLHEQWYDWSDSVPYSDP